VVEYAGGHGTAEATSGLPIDMRSIRCPFAKNLVGAAMNMEWIAVDFYRANCIGCVHRQPVGMPNLAMFVAELDEKAARGAQEQQRRAEAVRRRRRERAERRASTATGEPLAAATVLDDLDTVDMASDAEPGPERDQRDNARRRIVETARRASEAFSPAVISQLHELAHEPGHAWVFEALRHIARGGHADPRATIALALETLTVRHSSEASHVLVDLRDSLTSDDLSSQVVQALIHLAGTPRLRGVPQAFSQGRARDAAGLIVATELALPTVTSVLGEMLQVLPDEDREAPAVELWLPPGVGRRTSGTPDAMGRDTDRAAAAVAARPVLTAVPDAAGLLGPQLVDALDATDTDERVSPTAEIVETLAGLLLEQPAMTVRLLVVGGATGSQERRAHLFDVAERAVRELKHATRHPAAEADEDIQFVDGARDFPHHRLSSVDASAVVRHLFGFALERLCGDWGHDVAGDAGRLVSTLVNDYPAAVYADGRGVDTVIGHLIATAEAPRTASDLVPPGPLAGLEQMSRDQTRSSILRELRKAMRALAAEAPTVVLERVEPLLDAELPRGTARESNAGEVSEALAAGPSPPTSEEMAALDLRKELITLLGDVAHDHGLTAGVFRRVLPRLTTHLLGKHPSLRAASIRAWAKASRGGQPLPTTLSDCLPVLLTDTYLVVIGALLDVLPSLLYQSDCIEDQHLVLILRWVHAVEPAIRSQRPERESDVIGLLRAVADRFEGSVQTQLLARALDLGEHLSSHDLRHHLVRRWPLPIRTSTRFAQICLRAVGSPEIDDDRDEIITLLLNAWPGAAALSDDDIADLAARVRPEYPLMAGDHVELLGRLGRFHTAAAVTEKLLAAVPHVPAADTARAIARAMPAATRLELAVIALGTASTAATRPARIQDIAAAADAAEAAMSQMAAELSREDPVRAAHGLPSRPSGPARGMLNALGARVAAARALSGFVEGPMTLEQADRAAEICEAAAVELRRAYPAALSTAAAYEHYAEALDVVACLVRADAATRRADSSTSTAQLQAAHRRAAVLAEQLMGVEVGEAKQAFRDPLVAGLATVADSARTAGVEGTAILAQQLLSVGLPMRVIHGPWRRGPVAPTGRSSADADESRCNPIVVCLLSIDDCPLTEHAQVLQRDQLYTITVDVRGAGWPTWADRLELEPVSQLTEMELALPIFEFDRPSGLAEEDDYQLSASGALVVRFRLAPGRPATPVRLTGRFTGPPNDPAYSRNRRRAAVDVAGHPQVRLRPFDPTRDLLTDYRQVDERLLELFGRLHGRFPDAQLEPFARLLTAIVLDAERIQFDKMYKLGSRISEATFHQDLESRLRDDPTLGGRISRRDRRALGFVDLDHDQITAELKVERTTPVTEVNCHKYLGQPTQYASGADKRLSILVVLDMSRKEAPPGALENYVWLLQPSAHGLTNPAYPSVVAVVVINANNRVPSGWAHHRIDATLVDPSDGHGDAHGGPRG
jgi:hypothetical protein